MTDPIGDRSVRFPIAFPFALPQIACRGCGCTDERACPGGCWWVEDDLCSSCCPELDEEAPAGGLLLLEDL